jgi:hypothetical protein
MNKLVSILVGVGLATMLCLNAASASNWTKKSFDCATSSDTVPCSEPMRTTSGHTGTYSTTPLSAVDASRLRATYAGDDEDGRPVFDGNSVDIPAPNAFSPNWDTCQHFVAAVFVPYGCTGKAESGDQGPSNSSDGGNC